MNRKAIILPALAAIAALSSCTGDETIAQQKTVSAQTDALMFRPNVGAATRVAKDYNNSTIDQFFLRAAGVFKAPQSATGDNSAVTNQDVEDGTTVSSFAVTLNSSNSWNLPTTYETADDWKYGLYWGDRGSTGRFTGIAPATVREGSYTVAGGNDAQGYEAATDGRAQQEDIVVAYNEGGKNEFGNGVPMVFRHVLSRIEFRGVNKDYTNGFEVKVKAIKLVNIKTASSLSLPTSPTTESAFSWSSYTPWSAPSAPKWFYSKSGQEVTLNQAAANITFGDDFYMMPQQLTKADSTTLILAPASSAATAKQYVSFLIQVKAITGSATADIQGTANKKGIIWPYKKIAANASLGTIPAAWGWSAADSWTAGKYINKASYEAVINIDKDENGAALSSATDNKFDTADFEDCTAADYAWAAVPLGETWQPGKKYIYTLNYSSSGVGLVDPEDGVLARGGQNIMDDGPLKLWFTVSVVDWEEVTETKNLDED